MKTDEDGNILWQKSLGGSSFEFAWSAEQTMDGGYIIAGHTSSSDGDVSGWHEGSNAYTPFSDYWVVKLAPDESSAIAPLSTDWMSVFPNPADHHLHLQFSKPVSGKVTVLNMHGQQVLEQEIFLPSQSTALSISSFTPGVYIARFTSVKEILEVKIVKN